MDVRIALSACALLATGCVVTGSMRMPHPESGAVAPNHIVVDNEMGDETILGLPEGALSSDGRLIAMNREQTCFDVMLRFWRGAQPNFDVSLEVDGTIVAEAPRTLPECGVKDSCEAVYSELPPLPSDKDPRVRRFGGRVCFASVPIASREAALKIGKGAYALRFQWLLDRQPVSGSAVVRRSLTGVWSMRRPARV
jgi:hypothetical protein